MDKLGEATFEVKGKKGKRSAGRKDRLSKVWTAAGGTRDRRVRLSPHTAILFYDLQDRLGCDRPSKAIDWLMSEAKPAIHALHSPPTIQTQPQPDYDYDYDYQHPAPKCNISHILTTFSFTQDYSSVPVPVPVPLPSLHREPLQSTNYPQFQAFGLSHPNSPAAATFKDDHIPFSSYSSSTPAPFLY